jgi:hypothetical protein
MFSGNRALILITIIPIKIREQLKGNMLMQQTHSGVVSFNQRLIFTYTRQHTLYPPQVYKDHNRVYS